MFPYKCGRRPCGSLRQLSWAYLLQGAAIALPYVLKAEPASAGEAGLVLIKIFDDLHPYADVVKILMTAFEMSAPTARLTAALMKGEDLNGFAARAHLSINTVKFYLKAAFKATGTRRQVDLVALVASAIRDLA